MIPIPLRRYWPEVLEVLFILFIAGYVIFLHYENKGLSKDIEVLKSEKAQYQYALSFQNDKIVQNKSDYDEAIKKLPTVLKTIDTRYQTVYTTIEKWRDKNVSSDCNNSMQYLNSFQF